MLRLAFDDSGNFNENLVKNCDRKQIEVLLKKTSGCKEREAIESALLKLLYKPEKNEEGALDLAKLDFAISRTQTPKALQKPQG